MDYHDAVRASAEKPDGGFTARYDFLSLDG